MLRKILTASLVAVSLVGATLATTDSAEARYGRHRAFLGGAALGVLGGALLSGGYGYGNGYGYGYGRPYYDAYPAYYYPRRCHWERRFVDDYYGGYYERVKVCY